MWRLNLEHARTPWWIRLGVPLAVWQQRSGAQTLYLTFDDGPTPRATEFVLECLHSYQARATFFCLGRQVARYPELFARVLAAGHSIGNHGHDHLNGWQASTSDYMRDVATAADVMQSHSGFRTGLFRPAFGRIRWSAMWRLRADYQIVMWDSMSMDYRPDLASAAVASNVERSARDGSIVLWHDSELAEGHLRASLPRVLQYFSKAGFKFAGIPDGRPHRFAPPPLEPQTPAAVPLPAGNAPFVADS